MNPCGAFISRVAHMSEVSEYGDADNSYPPPHPAVMRTERILDSFIWSATDNHQVSFTTCPSDETEVCQQLAQQALENNGTHWWCPRTSEWTVMTGAWRSRCPHDPTIIAGPDSRYFNQRPPPFPSDHGGDGTGDSDDDTITEHRRDSSPSASDSGRGDSGDDASHDNNNPPEQGEGDHTSDSGDEPNHDENMSSIPLSAPHSRNIDATHPPSRPTSNPSPPQPSGQPQPLHHDIDSIIMAINNAVARCPSSERMEHWLVPTIINILRRSSLPPDSLADGGPIYSRFRELCSIRSQRRAAPPSSDRFTFTTGSIDEAWQQLLSQYIASPRTPHRGTQVRPPPGRDRHNHTMRHRSQPPTTLPSPPQRCNTSQANRSRPSDNHRRGSSAESSPNGSKRGAGHNHRPIVHQSNRSNPSSHHSCIRSTGSSPSSQRHGTCHHHHGSGGNSVRSGKDDRCTASSASTLRQRSGRNCRRQGEDHIRSGSRAGRFRTTGNKHQWWYLSVSGMGERISGEDFMNDLRVLGLNVPQDSRIYQHRGNTRIMVVSSRQICDRIISQSCTKARMLPGIKIKHFDPSSNPRCSRERMAFVTTLAAIQVARYGGNRSETSHSPSPAPATSSAQTSTRTRNSSSGRKSPTHRGTMPRKRYNPSKGSHHKCRRRDTSPSSSIFSSSSGNSNGGSSSRSSNHRSRSSPRASTPSRSSPSHHHWSRANRSSSSGAGSSSSNQRSRVSRRSTAPSQSPTTRRHRQPSSKRWYITVGGVDTHFSNSSLRQRLSLAGIRLPSSVHLHRGHGMTRALSCSSEEEAQEVMDLFQHGGNGMPKMWVFPYNPTFEPPHPIRYKAFLQALQSDGAGGSN